MTPGGGTSLSAASLGAAVDAPNTKKLSGAWAKPDLAGGCPKHATWRENPQFVLVPSRNGRFRVALSQSKGAAMQPMGMVMLQVEEGTPLPETYRSDVAVAGSKTKYKKTERVEVTLDLDEAQCYVVLPSTRARSVADVARRGSLPPSVCRPGALRPHALLPTQVRARAGGQLRGEREQRRRSRLPI